MTDKTEGTKAAENYYDSSDADTFYATIWGGNDIHVGLYASEDEPIADASARTVEKIASRLPPLDENSEVIDVGAGYGGAGRYLVKKYGCKVVDFNLSEKENQRNRELNKQEGLGDKIEVVQGNFESIPYEDNRFDVVWCQDAIVHSDNRKQVINEIGRILKPGGHFIFTEFLQSPDCPKEILEPILKRIHLSSFETLDSYRKKAEEAGMEEVEYIDYSDQFTRHYSRVQQETRNRYDELTKVCSKEYVDGMIDGLSYWIDGGKKGYLHWGIMHFKKKK